MNVHLSRTRFSLTLLWCLAIMSSAIAGAEPDLAAAFSAANAHGTIVVVDQRRTESVQWEHNPQRAAERFSPASTFKIAHTLFALDAGVVRDEFERFAWDGVRRSFPGHDADQDLRSAMRVSAVWVYQRFAAAIGRERARSYLAQIHYGNADPGSSDGDYWLDGPLAISAREQIAFLQQLYRNRLPFTVEHQRLVKDILIIEAGRDWILRAKTGWDGRIGWWVGWVEWPEGPVFFALNIDTPARIDDLAKREQIGRAVLQSLHALPGSGAASMR